MTIPKYKSKITLEQYQLGSKDYRYKVVALQNRTEPKIGAELKEEDVCKLLDYYKADITIDIKPSPKKK